MTTLNFPNNPTPGQQYSAPNGFVYTWGNQGVWTASGSAPNPNPASITTPSIISPVDGSTGVGTSSGVILTGSPYSGVNNPGDHLSTDWELSLSDGSTVSTNPITAVSQGAYEWTPASTDSPLFPSSPFGSTATSPCSVAYGNGAYVAVRGNGSTINVFRSTNLTTWPSTAVPYSGSRSSIDNYVKVKYLNGKFVIIGVVSGGTTGFLHSSDGISWAYKGVATGSITYMDLAWGAGYWVAVFSNKKIYAAPDLVSSFTEVAQDTSSYNLDLCAIEYGGGKFLFAYREDDQGGGTFPKIRCGKKEARVKMLQVPFDSGSWTISNSFAVSPQFGSNDLSYMSLKYGNGVWLWVFGRPDPDAGTVIYRSTDGVTWSTIGTISQHTAMDVAFGNGTFMAAGYGFKNNLSPFTTYAGTIVTSSDGIVWSPRSFADSFADSSDVSRNGILGVTYGASSFVAVGTLTSISNNIETGQAGQSSIGSSVLTIFGANSQGFSLGDIVSNGITGSNAISGTITAITSTSVTVSPGSPYWTVGQYLTKDDVIVYVPQSTTNLTSLAIPIPPIESNTTYYARLRYRSDSSPSIVSNWSAWSEFTTGTLTPTLTIGQAYGGGYIGGFISYNGNGIPTHVLIVAPKSTESLLQWSTNSSGTAADSLYDGFFNSQSINSAAYPAASYCRSLTTGGFTDWYLPAYYEMDIVYTNLKPSTTANENSEFQTLYGNTNIYACPAFTYTPSNPTQTAVVNFQAPGPQAFSEQEYWTSVERNGQDNQAWVFDFNNSGGEDRGKGNTYKVRAIRRIPL